ncbi:MAG: PepSY-associated TM helix domain-containing protein [Bacteroidota bacterium]
MKKFKKIVGKGHLWLGFGSGLIVLFLGITGCILAFEREIELVTIPEQFTEERDHSFVQPSIIKEKAEAALPGKHIHGIGYGKPGKSAVVSFYNEDPSYYYLVYCNPYDGEVLRAKNMDEDFFRFIIDGHFYLWLPPAIGQPVVASATLIFVLMMITGIILWWPKNKPAAKQRFTIKWNAKWRRVNYDLHNVFGFYMTWVVIFIALTGLVWGFQWFSTSVYWITSGGKTMTEFYLPNSDTTRAAKTSEIAIDVLWARVSNQYPSAESIEVHVPESDTASIEVAVNPDEQTYWRTDYLYFDQYTLEEIPVKHAFGRLSNTSVADKIMRMNYDLHVGAVGGLPGKVMAFIASLICASLPVTGVYIWWGRRMKEKKNQSLVFQTIHRVSTRPLVSFINKYDHRDRNHDQHRWNICHHSTFDAIGKSV